MAKGNDGNLLQHEVELRLATRLAGLGDGRLHVALTHGMAPYEPCDHPRTTVAHDRLDGVLKSLAGEPGPEDTPLVRAYRTCAATREHYPNSAELIASLIGRENVEGCITENDPTKFEELAAAWAGTHVQVREGSWRREVGEGGGLCCPPDLDRPWLLSMDPLTWREDETDAHSGDKDDAHLRAGDLRRIEDVLRGYMASGYPGAASIFVYKVPPPLQSTFWLRMTNLARELDVRGHGHAADYDDTCRNLAAVFTTPA